MCFRQVCVLHTYTSPYKKSRNKTTRDEKVPSQTSPFEKDRSQTSPFEKGGLRGICFELNEELAA